MCESSSCSVIFFSFPFYVLQHRWFHHMPDSFHEWTDASLKTASAGQWQNRASDLSGIALVVVIEVIHCSDVLKLWRDLLGMLPFTLIGLATKWDGSHRWETRSERLKSPASYLPWGALSLSWEQITHIAGEARSHTQDTHSFIFTHRLCCFH